jgi:hypothetical protein
VVKNKFPYLLNLTDYELAHLAMRILFGNATEMVEEKVCDSIVYVQCNVNSVGCSDNGFDAEGFF